MKVDSLNSNRSIYSAKDKAQLSKKYGEDLSTKSSTKAITDKLELSEEARKLQPIIIKVQSGFYENHDVFKKVAERLNKELPKA